MTDIAGYDYLSSRGSAWETEPEPPRRWKLDAACRDANPELFWPETPDYRRAEILCRRCPVIAECMEAAIREGDYGHNAVYRAGMTGRSRMDASRALRVERTCKSCRGQFIATTTAAYCSEVCRQHAKRLSTARWRRG